MCFLTNRLDAAYNFGKSTNKYAFKVINMTYLKKIILMFSVKKNNDRKRDLGSCSSCCLETITCTVLYILSDL